MEFLTALWLPIIIISVVLFVASFVAWVILPHHFGDWKKLEKEQEFMDAVSGLNLPPGNYMYPMTHAKAEQNSDEFRERYMKGPRGVLSTWEVPNMGVNLGLTLVFFLVTTAIIAYITYAALGPGSDMFMKVLQIAGAIGVLTHASSGVLNAIWFKRRVIMDVVDGVVYGIIIGLIFALMWPAVAG